MNTIDVVNKGRKSNHILPRKSMDTKQTTSNIEKVLTSSILASIPHRYLHITEPCFNEKKVWAHAKLSSTWKGCR
ncbi:unnamed protein product [Camellia sinensis]